ncbi:MAG: hypothetical protein H6650_14715 [Ardenticatenales bacterium]|nr:hypothetical protein [Ardenticatenales bacterium]
MTSPAKITFPEASSRMMALDNSFREDVLIYGGAPRRMTSPAKITFPEASSRMMALDNSFREDVLIYGGAPRRMTSPAKKWSVVSKRWSVEPRPNRSQNQFGLSA